MFVKGLNLSRDAVANSLGLKSERDPQAALRRILQRGLKE